ncbi:MAG: hypothetical protein ACREIU_11865, partial [Planctomycetota bacterium]
MGRESRPPRAGDEEGIQGLFRKVREDLAGTGGSPVPEKPVPQPQGIPALSPRRHEPARRLPRPARGPVSSLGTKTTALFLAAALPPLLGSGAAVYLVARSALLRDASARQEAAGRASARLVQDYLGRAQAKIHSLASL